MSDQTLKLLFGILSLIPAFFAYYIYFKNLFAGKIKPHAFSWFIWGTLSGIGFAVQVGAHGGIGTWATVLTSLASLSICVVSFYKGTTQPTRLDWILLALAMTGLMSLLAVDNKLVALLITLFALCIGFAITLKKAYKKPREENATAFLLNTFKFVPAIFCAQ